jgi:hypothetical protein
MPDDSGDSDDLDVTTVVSQLNIYLREHPNSADTAEGIARWWFDSVPRPTTEQVGAALSWMEALGVVEALPAADGKVRYRLRRGKPGPAGRSPPMSGGH